jgi:lipopolysaccharide/colanic/teichoic acid biosynthesis glycosyltransferase
MKRLLDILGAIVALLLLWPLLLAVAVTVRLGSPGPVLFRQVRVGKGGRLFTIFKFRSMVLDAEKRGGFSTADNDPRITPVGAFIRRTSLDELPQIFNVLRGEMSWVGPRPDVPAQRNDYTEEEWKLRHRVRPGITGLAQASLRSLATPEQRKALDLEYAAHASLAMDFKILIMTVRQVLIRGGN